MIRHIYNLFVHNLYKITVNFNIMDIIKLIDDNHTEFIKAIVYKTVYKKINTNRYERNIIVANLTSPEVSYTPQLNKDLLLNKLYEIKDNMSIESLCSLIIDHNYLDLSNELNNYIFNRYRVCGFLYLNDSVKLIKDFQKFSDNECVILFTMIVSDYLYSIIDNFISIYRNILYDNMFDNMHHNDLDIEKQIENLHDYIIDSIELYKEDIRKIS